MQQWHLLQTTPVRWLVDGLFPGDGYSAVVGKPKSAKSTVLRNLVAAVIKGREFLGRKINIPNKEPGRVLFIHLDRKDRPARVVAEFKQLGITAPDEVSRLHLMFPEDLPGDPSEDPSFLARLQWLQGEIQTAKPHLVVIDLWHQFACVSSVNDYKASLKAINALQDALAEIKYDGALIVALHGRKSTNPDQPFDDVLGSTGQRGSFSTLVMLTQYRREKRYTIQSDQTEREAPWGELDETVIHQNPDGTLTLGEAVADLAKVAKGAKLEEDLRNLVGYLEANPGSETEQVVKELSISPNRFLELVKTAGESIYYTGKGVKGSPKLYFAKQSGLEAYAGMAEIPAAISPAQNMIERFA